MWAVAGARPLSGVDLGPQAGHRCHARALDPRGKCGPDTGWRGVAPRSALRPDVCRAAHRRHRLRHGANGTDDPGAVWRYLFRLAALYVGVSDTVAILIRRAVGLHRADPAALIAATSEVGTDGARRAIAYTAGPAAPAAHAPVAIIAAAPHGNDQHQC